MGLFYSQILVFFLGTLLVQAFSIAVNFTEMLSLSLGIGLIISLLCGMLGLFSISIQILVPTLDLDRIQIITKDKINWSLSIFTHNIKKSLIENLFLGLVTFLMISTIGMLFLGLFEGLVVGLIGGIFMTLVIGLYEGLLDGINSHIINSQSYLKITHPYQRFYASMWSLYFSILQHFHLRRILYKKDLLPWRLVDFLNEATKNNILESDGGSWRFRHRILQDYFAKYWEDNYAATEDGTVIKEEE